MVQEKARAEPTVELTKPASSRRLAQPSLRFGSMASTLE
jgi:hypothetical protein